MTKSEIVNGVLKGLGQRPTRYLFRYSPPFTLELLEVMRCGVDGGIVTLKSAQSPLAALHAGHRINSPSIFSLWEFIKVQLRIIQ